MVRMLDTGEAARRLGVKPATLYAYVSRGLLASHPAPEGPRRSLFDEGDVERLARRSRESRAVETRLATVTTAITQLTDRGPLYRGRLATDLATTTAFEAVASLVWGERSGAVGGEGSAEVGGGPAWEPLPLGPVPEVDPSDRMRWAVVMAGAGDRLRSDLRPEGTVRRARRLMASMVDVLPPPVHHDRQAVTTGPSTAGPPTTVGPPGGSGPDLAGSLAGRLAGALCPQPGPGVVRWVNAALVLLADHELATSTMAVRVAASTRADLYDAVLVGLGTLSGPLHGGASPQAHALLLDARRQGAEGALDAALRWQGTPPGFGHMVYREGDPRFDALSGLLADIASPDDRALVSSLVSVAADHDFPRPNIDLALAAGVLAADMPPEAGRILFAVARVAGWVAHYLEELEERPLRYRARAIYATQAR